MTKQFTVPVLIIGAGAAGAKSAIEMSKNGVDPLVVSKRDHGDAHTTWARGGINASLGNLDAEDSWEIHAADTLDEGHFINNPTAVKTVTKNMPDVIRELDEWGMELNKTEDGSIDQRYFGAQSYRRTCFAGDYTGESLLDTLVSKAQSMDIDYLDNVYITRLLSDGSTVYGAFGYDMETGESLLFVADKIILAAGGHTSIYNRHSSRDTENTGDGVGLAYQANAELMDMEFVQFHPTGMVGKRYGEEWDGRLVTEAVRGEGGRLYNSNGDRFMEDYSPKQMELDARDVVARAIETEIRQGRGTENDGVYLDISHKSETFIEERLPRMKERFDKLGVDISDEPMEVAPTAHYVMGGVKFDPQTGETKINDLHVLGETTAGVHGANRLGGNSLAETVSVGTVVGEHIAAMNPTEPDKETIIKATNIAKKEESRLKLLENSKGEHLPSELISDLRQLMEDYCGIRRNEQKLKMGLKKVRDIETKLETALTINEPRSSKQFELANNLRFMIIAARATLKGSLLRTESRGAHYRTDHTDKDPTQQNNIIYENGNSGMDTYRDTFSSISDEIQNALDEEHELDYHHLE